MIDTLLAEVQSLADARLPEVLQRVARSPVYAGRWCAHGWAWSCPSCRNSIFSHKGKCDKHRDLRHDVALAGVAYTRAKRAYNNYGVAYYILFQAKTAYENARTKFRRARELCGCEPDKNRHDNPRNTRKEKNDVTKRSYPHCVHGFHFAFPCSFGCTWDPSTGWRAPAEWVHHSEDSG